MVITPNPIDVPLWTDQDGRIRIADTRILLETVIHAFWQGESAEGSIDSYPTLKLADLYAVLAYYLTHRTEVDAYVRESDQEADRIQRQIEENYPPETLALRARLRVLRDNQRL
jgi:uncharacterized protein (DUF433 family)